MISENHTQNVKVNIIVQETGQPIITDGATITLSSFLSDSGLSESNTLSGNITWSNKEIPLFNSKNTDLTLLPRMAQVVITWKGNVSGTALTDGTKTLKVSVDDLDDNSSEDTLHHLYNEPAPFSDDIKNLTFAKLCQPKQEISNVLQNSY